MVEAIVQRIVPGAPPPQPLSKSQKKKRKTNTKGKLDGPAESPVVETSDIQSATVSEKAPPQEDVKEGSVAPDLPTEQEVPPAEEEFSLKPSPIVDLITKRLKATTKKIVSSYIPQKRWMLR